jgi:hypothetical protein
MNRLEFIFPVLIGDLQEDHTHNHYFENGCHPNLADNDTHVMAVEREMKRHFDRLLIGKTKTSYENQSISTILESITINQGAFINGDRELCIARIMRDVDRMLECSAATACRDEPSLGLVCRGGHISGRGALLGAAAVGVIVGAVIGMLGAGIGVGGGEL